MDIFFDCLFLLTVLVCYLQYRVIRILRREADDLASMVRYYESMMPDFVVRQVQNKKNRRKQHETNENY